jgi:hypothetical protein
MRRQPPRGLTGLQTTCTMSAHRRSVLSAHRSFAGRPSAVSTALVLAMGSTVGSANVVREYSSSNYRQ